MIKLLSLDQLAHKASCDDNALALAILAQLDEAVETAVEKATSTNDADYSYKVWDAINAVQFLLAAEWYKVETRQTDRITYQIKHLQEDTNPFNNHIGLFKYKGGDCWRLKVCGGEHGEQIEEVKFSAAGFKAAQTQAVQDIISLIGNGLELNA